MECPEFTISIPSNRIYIDTLTEEQQKSLLLTQKVYSSAKEKLYNIKSH